MRIDKLLWYLRLTKTRSAAQTLVNGGHVRCNALRVGRAAHGVAIGDVLTLPLPGGVLVLTLDTLPTRRGPPAEARACYRVLDGAAAYPIAASIHSAPEGSLQP